jgi:hypothetical protein
MPTKRMTIAIGVAQEPISDASLVLLGPVPPGGIPGRFESAAPPESPTPPTGSVPNPMPSCLLTATTAFASPRKSRSHELSENGYLNW